MSGKNKRLPVFLLVMAIFAGLILFFLDFQRINAPGENQKVLVPIQQSFTYDPESQASFRIFSKGFIRCTRDGVSAFSFKGELLWNQTHSMEHPYMTYDGDMTAVAENGGRNIYVYGPEGLLYNISIEQSILYMNVNRTGYLAVRYKEENVYKTRVYKNENQIILDSDTVDAGVYPTAIDVSDDGQVVAIAYIDTNGVHIQSNLVFYTTKDYDNNVLRSGSQKNDELISMLRFFKDDVLLSLSDRYIYLFSASGEELSVIPCANEIDAIAFESDYFVVAYGKKALDEDSKEPGSLIWYNLKGEQTAEITLTRQASMMKAYGKYTVVSDGKLFYCFNRNGSQVWQQPITADLKDIIPYDRGNSHLALMVEQSAANVMKLERWREAPDAGAGLTDSAEGDEPVLEEEIQSEEPFDKADQADMLQLNSDNE